jgi:competence protein ComEC
VRFELLFPILFFLLSLILAVPRSYDPYLYEEDLGEGRLILRVEGVGEISEKGFSARVKVLGGDFPEIYEKTAFLRVYGAEDVPSKYLEVYGKVRVREGRIFISATYKDVAFANVPPSLRDRLAKRLEDKIKDQEVRALALAYFLGEDQSVVPMRVQSAFLTTGLVHLLVVSGGHLSLLALMLRFLAPYRLGLWLALLGVSFYALLLVPSEPPVLRAYLMILASILLAFVWRKTKPFGYSVSIRWRNTSFLS